jgi:hypothetical protein
MKFLLIALSFLLVASAQAAGVCSTGSYKTCMTCCATNGTITNRDACSSGCSVFKDSPLQKEIEAKKKPAGR